MNGQDDIEQILRRDLPAIQNHEDRRRVSHPWLFL